MFGVGLRAQHYSHLEQRPQTDLDWFEVISENHMDSRGRPWDMLKIIRQDYDLSMHGVSLSIGSYQDFNQEYLKNLKEMVDTFNPIRVSDHLCWTGLKEANLHNLLPLPYEQDVLQYLVDRIDYVQNYLGRQILIENLSAYFDYQDSVMKEWDFLAELANRSGCGLLMDVNNIYVNSKNHGFDPKIYVDALPKDKVGEIHLAGHTDMGKYLFDTHSKPVCDEVWELYKYAIKDLKDVPVLIEWDDDIPEFERLHQEAMLAKKIWHEVKGESDE